MKDYAIQPVAFTHVHLTDHFWEPKLEVNANVTIPYILRQCREQGRIDNFLRAAQSRIGLPYVWGAAGPASFDCSGLVQWAFAQAGVRMPRVSEEQWFTGPHISYSDARPGDLLFWHYDRTDPTDIDHVAIYAGNGMMIVAPHTGTYVSYEPVPFGNFAGVVLVDPALGAELAW